MTDQSNRKAAFEKIYEEGYWEPGCPSGHGSTLDATVLVRGVIERVVLDHQIQSIVDVACGDMAWMPDVLAKLEVSCASITYIGCDIVSALILSHQSRFPNLIFNQLDFVVDKIPKAELIICREALQHLPVRDIKRALHNFSTSGSKYLLATLHLRRYGLRNHLSMRPGRCRDRNFLLPPFSLPNPIAIYPEEFGAKDKFIGLWTLPFST